MIMNNNLFKSKRSTRICTYNTNLNLLKSKRSQLTVFIILALILVAGVTLVVVVINGIRNNYFFIGDPESYLQRCMEEAMNLAEKQLIEANGYLNKTDNYIFYRGEKVYYLCKASEYYFPCVNQEPMFLEHLRSEIEVPIKKQVDNCVSNLIKDFEKRGYSVVQNNLSVEVDFFQNEISTILLGQMAISREDENMIIDRVSSRISSPLENFGKISQVIANYESTLCMFDNVKFSKVFPSVLIARFVTGEQTKVYTMTDKFSGKEFSIAIKSCDLPAGV